MAALGMAALQVHMLSKRRMVGTAWHAAASGHSAPAPASRPGVVADTDIGGSHSTVAYGARAVAATAVGYGSCVDMVAAGKLAADILAADRSDRSVADMLVADWLPGGRLGMPMAGNQAAGRLVVMASGAAAAAVRLPLQPAPAEEAASTA